MFNIKTTKWLAFLFFAQGAPYAIMALLGTLLFHGFNLDVSTITLLSSLLLLPWSIKPLWVHTLEPYKNKKKPLALCQLIQAIAFACIIVILSLHGTWIGCLLFLFIAAFSAASYDILSDGYYMFNLSSKEQNFFIGQRILFYQLGKLSIQFGAVIAIGQLLRHFSFFTAWTLLFACIGFYALCIAILCQLQLTPIQNNKESGDHFKPIKNLIDFIHQPHGVLFIVYCFLYNAPEAQLQRILPLFIIEPNGLAQSTSMVGWSLGLFGSSALLAGAFISGWAGSRWPLRRLMVPLSLSTILGNSALFILLRPNPSFWLICLCISIAQFFFGLGNSIFIQSLLKKCGIHQQKMSHYTFSTALMGLSFVIFGSISGNILGALGYPSFFLMICLTGLIPSALAWLLKQRDHSLSSSNDDQKTESPLPSNHEY